MTHSLLSSWKYAMQDVDRDTLSDFLSTLKREKHEPTEAMRTGIRFEDEVTSILNGDVCDEFPTASEVAKRVRGGKLQLVASREMTVNGRDILLYGRLDVLKAGIIYDIKYTGKYERGKFFSSTQHPTYFELIPEANEFTYLISDGKELWTETYRRDETRSILPMISDFFSWMQMCGYMDIYEQYWACK
ncbi:MAG: hypothetical protein MJY95_08290 [Bacteroidaceae bacterium]|nr:hypothetical protein [Bacteroidaceae bacterium]